MIFNEQDVIILDRNGDETGQAGPWSDDLDDYARKCGGYAVVINSEPPVILADYR